MIYLLLFCAFMLGLLAGLLVALWMVWPPLDGLVKFLHHVPKG